MRSWFLLFLFILIFGFKGLAQTFINVDLTSAADITKTYSGARSGSYCNDNNCIVFDITLNANSDLLNFNADQLTGASFYTVHDANTTNCGPLIPIGTPACISGLTHAIISFCKPGGNSVNYTITASSIVRGSDPITLRQGCTGTISVTGLTASNTTWTSIYPGATGAYNSYLSCTSGCTSTNVTPGAGAPAYIDYRVSGTTTNCSASRFAVVRVYTVPPMAVNINPSSAVICSGNPVTLSAMVTGGNPAYSYSWMKDGQSIPQTTATITVSTIGIYTVTVADNTANCSPVSQSATVTAAATPSAPTAPGTAICKNTAATLTATAPGGTYNWYDANGSFQATGASFATPILTASTTYYVDVTSAAGCTSPRTAVTVTVNPIPAAPTASGTTICSGNTATLTATAPGGTYNWYATASGGNVLATNASFTTPFLTANTTYYVDATSAAGCISARTAVTVTVNPVPPAPTASGTIICSGSQATLTATAPGGNYEWFDVPSGGTLLAANASFTTPFLSNTTTYYVQTTVNGCTSARTSVTVTVNPIPAAPTASGTTICSGNSATLTATAPGGNYKWFDAASGGNLLSANASFTTPFLVSTTTYYVQTTVNGCTSTRTAVTVTVNPIPAAPAASGTTICSGNSATLTASGSSGTYEWFDAASGGTSLSANASFTTPFLSSTTTYYVQTTVNGCISARTAVTVTVNPVPAAPTASGTTICNNTTATLTATAPGGTYNWYAAASGGNLLFTGASFTTPFLTSSTTYYVDATSAEGCTSPRTAVMVTVLPPTDPAFNYPSNTFCKTGTNPVPVTASSSGGTFSASPAGLVFVDNHTGEINLSASTAGNYTITFVTNTTCVYSSSSTLTITNGPDAAFSYSGPYCQQQTNPLPTLPAGSTAGMFSSPGPGIVFVNSGTGEIDLQQSVPGTYTVRNDIAAANGCAATFATTTVTVNSLPIVNAGADQVVCSGQTVTLNGSIGGGAGSATWSGGTGTFSNPSSPQTIYTPGAGETSATLVLTTNDPAGPCGAAVDELQITVKPTPSVTSLASAAVCNETAQNYIITSNVSGTTFSWSRAGVAGISNAAVGNQNSNTITETLVNTTSAPVAVTYTIVPEANGCTGNQFQYVVTVNPTATVMSAASAVICNQTAQNYMITSNVSGTTFSWSRAVVAGISNSSFSGQTSSRITETLNNTTSSPVSVTYRIVPEANGCTGTPFNYEVTVNPTPTITSPANAVGCNQTNQNYAITSNVNTATFSWGRAAVAGISNAAVSSQSSNSITEALVNTTNAPVAVTYNIIPEANGCAGTAFNYTITVNPTPALSNTSFSQVICSEGSSVPVTLTSDVNGANFTWTATASAGITGYAASGTAIIPAQTLVNAGLSTGTVTYTIKPFYNGCEGITSTYTITVNPKPAVNSAASAVVCNGAAQNYTISSNINGATFSWGRAAVAGIGNPAVNGQTSNTVTETLVNTTSAPIAVNYIIVPEANGCAGAAFNYTVTVNPTPTVTSAASAAVCNKTPQNYTITSDVSGTTYTWSRHAVSGISNPAVNGQTSNTITEALVNTTSAPVAVTYNIIPEANGCTGATFNYTVTVNPTPTVTSAASAVICNQSAQNYIITSDVSGTTFTWSRAAVTGISNAGFGNQTSNTITEVLVNTTNAQVAVTYNIIPEANGCTGTTFNYTVTVNSTATVTSVASAAVCNETAQNYPLTSNVSGATFNWGRAAIAGISNASVSGQTSNTITETLVNTTSAPIAVTYTIVPEANGCTGVSFDYKVTVNPTSTVTSASSGTICNQTAQNYTITSDVSGTTFIWGRAAVAGISNAAVSSQTGNSITEPLTNTTSSPIAVTYTIMPEVNGCSGTPFRYEVTVNPTPALSNTSFSQVICSEGSSVPVTFTLNTSGTNFTWTATATSDITGYAASGTAIIPAQTLINPGLSAGTVTYTIKPFYNGCEGVSSTYTITVNPKPATPLVSSNSPVCNGTSLMLTTPAVAGAIYTWTGPDGFTSNLQNPEITNANAAAQGTYSLTITANSCTGNAGTTTVMVNPTPPTPVAGSNGPICAGETLNLTASNILGATYNWTGPNGFTSSVQNPVVDNARVAASGNYSVKATVNGCIGNAGTIAVAVNAIPPAPSVSSNSPVCATTNLNLTAAGIAGANYNWTGPNGFTSTLQNPVISSATPANSGTYSVTASAGGCTSPASSIIVLVNPLPAEPVLTSNSPVCSGNTIVLACTAYPGVVYQWTGPNSFTSNRQNPVIDNAETVNQGRYTVVITTPGCTVTNTAFIDIKVNQTPAAPVAGSNSPVCVGQTLKLSAATVAGAIYNWTGLNGFISHLQNPEIADVNPEQGGKYFVTVTVNGCTSAIASTTVIVNKPSVVVAGNAQTVCANNPAVALSGSISGSSSTGIWSSTGSGTFTTGNTNLKGVYIASAADVVSGSIMLTLTATNTSPCAVASASFKVTIIPVPVVFAGEDQNVCINDQVTLNGKITNSNGSVWSSSGTGSFSPSNTSLTANYIFSEKDRAKGSIVLTLTAAGNGNCTAVSDQLKINIVALPKVNAGQDIYVMQDEHMVLQPAVSGTGLKYNWTPDLYLDNPTLKNPTLTGTEDITYTLTVTGTAGCVAQDQVSVKVLKPITIPNTFTPNNDGINDTWAIKELYNYPDITVKIFNRYGLQVFYSQGYGTPWDGTYNGQPLPVGTYYYIIDLKTYSKLRSGPVTIIR